MFGITHKNYRTLRWLVWLLLPVRAAHELTHALVGRRWASSVSIDWRLPAVTFVWDGAPYYGVVAAHMAPFVVGYSLGTVTIALALFGGLWNLSTAATVWLVGNWLYYSFPTRRDLSVLSLSRTAANGERTEIQM